MSLSRATSNVSFSSNEIQVKIPWQYRWKRPRIASAHSQIPSKPQAQTSSKSKSQADDNTPKSTDQSIRDQLKDKIPIGTSSARLNQEEVGFLLQSRDDALKDGNNSSKSMQRMKWEDLESESDDEESSQNGRAMEELNEEYIITVTIFASKSFVNLIQSKSKNEKTVIPADAVLLEVVRDSYQVESDTLVDEMERDEVEVVMSKLLFWPTSVLIDTASELKSETDEVEQIQQAEQTQREESGEDRAGIKELESKLLANADGRKTKQDLISAWKAIRNVLKLPKSLEEMTDEEKRIYEDKQLELRLKQARRKIGVTSVAICRKARISDNHIDMDEIMDVLNRMTLGIGLDLNPDLLATRIEQSQRNTEYSANEQQQNEELLLSCLCNDGKVHVFSILDLLRTKPPNVRDNEKLNLVDVMSRKGNSEDAFFNSFESLLLGDSLKTSLENSFLPLSKPHSTIDLSVVAMKGKIGRGMEVRDEDNATLDKAGAQLVKMRDAIGKGIDEYGPHFDFSLLDANIESSTMHDRTVNNIPLICTSAFEYIAVGGSGVRKRRFAKQRNAEDAIENAQPTRKDYTLPGGFITLISTVHFTESRTMFLPFVPKLIYPALWKSMQMIIVLGEEADKCIAIRTDSSSYVPSASPQNTGYFSESLTGEVSFGRSSSKQLDFVKKFTPMQISFDNLAEDMASGSFPVSVTCMPALPPTVLLCSIDSGDIYLQNFSLDLIQFGLIRPEAPLDVTASAACIRTQSDPRKLVVISPTAHFDASVEDLMRGSSAYFCKDSLSCISGQGWTVLSVQIKKRMHLFFTSWEGSTEEDATFHREIAVVDAPNDEVLCNIPNRKYLDTVAERGKTQISSTYQQVAIGSLHNSASKDKNLYITMRSKVVSDGISSSYEDVLSWLSIQNDYITAASVALSILGDDEALVDLEKSAAPRNGEYHKIRKASLLESITPLSLLETEKRARHIQSDSTLGSAVSYHDMLRKRILASLSNKALDCLTNGGSAMAHVLDRFLGRNEYYDETSACQILVSCATQTIRHLDAADMQHLAPYSYNPMQSEGHALWPIQCLLRVAVARKCMVTALNMLNDKIPDELRHRSSYAWDDDKNACPSSLKLSKSIISMILAAEESAGGVLMSLVERGTDRLYWDSLDDKTRLSLSMLHVQGRYPLLREIEVRQWALKLLHTGTGLIEDSSSDGTALVPSEWLREMCTGILCNAGCDLSQTILFTPALPIDTGEELDTDNKDMFQQMQEEEEDLYDYLAAAPGCGGIDFDMIIPSFLILEKRKIHWLGNEKVPSQTILDVVCDLAGRHSSEEPIFAFDSVPVMKQCVIMENASAAAALIGGHNGLVLKCAHILTMEGNLSIAEAERLLLQEAEENTTLPQQEEEKRNVHETEFNITDGHKSILWLLEKHTLRVKRYGDFYSKGSRGKIDPVFAARICLRAWLHLTRTHHGSSRWLENWFRQRLELDTIDITSNRLPCAAIIRALIWTEGLSEAEGSELEKRPVLAMALGFSMHFVVQIARVPCGLLECVPRQSNAQLKS